MSDGKGIASPHKQMSLDVNAERPPMVQIDFQFLGAEGLEVDSSEAHITTLTCVDEQTGIPHCVSVPTKSPSDGYMVASVCKWLERICRTKIILRSDGEPAISKLTGMIKNKRLKEGFETMVQTGPRYSSQSLGAIGAAQRLFIGQMRTMRADLELRFGRQNSPRPSDLCLDGPPCMLVVGKVPSESGWDNTILRSLRPQLPMRSDTLRGVLPVSIQQLPETGQQEDDQEDRSHFLQGGVARQGFHHRRAHSSQQHGRLPHQNGEEDGGDNAPPARDARRVLGSTLERARHRIQSKSAVLARSCGWRATGPGAERRNRGDRANRSDSGRRNRAG